MSAQDSEQLPPKVFISYRWTSPAHEEWVLRIATALRGDGVDVILDKWHLQEGQDTLAFMEQMVSDPNMSKVLLICDKGYVDRANSRTGGVGTEAQIISASVYEKTDQNKVAAVVTELNTDGKPYLPTYMSTRLYFDMSTLDSEAINYEKLLRWIFGKPFHALPPLGEKPSFPENSYATGTSFARIAQSPASTPNNKNTNSAHEILRLISRDSFKFIENLAGKPNPENIAYEKMKETFPVLENLYLAFQELINDESEKSSESIHKFFEYLLENLDYTPQGTHTRIDNDAYRFFCHDALTSFVALCMSNRKFLFARNVLSIPFFKPGHDQRTGQSVSYTAFQSHLSSLEYRNQNQDLRRISLKADLFHEKHKHSIVNQRYFMEADLTLFLRGYISKESRWYPESAIYLESSYGSMPTFARAVSKIFYDKVKAILFDMSADELRNTITGIESPHRTFRGGLDLKTLFNAENLASTP